MPVHKVNELGIARTFQNIRLFSDMTVLDNVKVGLHNSMKCSFFSSILHLPGYCKSREAAPMSRLWSCWISWGLRNMPTRRRAACPTASQRRLEIVRALATNPSVLLLDEPAAGMNPS